MAAMKVETDIIVNITSSLKGWAVALVKTSGMSKTSKQTVTRKSGYFGVG